MRLTITLVSVVALAARSAWGKAVFAHFMVSVWFILDCLIALNVHQGGEHGLLRRESVED